MNQVECHVIRIKTDSIGSFYGFKVKAECLNWLFAETWLALETFGFELPWPVFHILYRGKSDAINLTYILWRVFKIILQCILRNDFLTGLLKVECIESKHTAVGWNHENLLGIAVFPSDGLPSAIHLDVNFQTGIFVDAVITKSVYLIVMFQIVNGLPENTQFIAMQTFFILIFYTIEHSLENFLIGKRELNMMLHGHIGGQHDRPIMKYSLINTECQRSADILDSLLVAIFVGLFKPCP